MTTTARTYKYNNSNNKNKRKLCRPTKYEIMIFKLFSLCECCAEMRCTLHIAGFLQNRPAFGEWNTRHIRKLGDCIWRQVRNEAYKSDMEYIKAIGSDSCFHNTLFYSHSLSVSLYFFGNVRHSASAAFDGYITFMIFWCLFRKPMQQNLMTT